MFDTSARSKGFARKKVNNPAFDAGKVLEACPRIYDSAENPMRSESEHRRCVASTALLQHVPFCHRLCLARQNRQQTGVSVGGALLDLVDEPV